MFGIRDFATFSMLTALCGMAFPAFAADNTDTDLPALPAHTLILTEVGGGADSAVSPDGKWLAFSSRRSGNLDVWIANIETGERRQITTHPAADNEARWHPDSNQLTFVTMRDGSQDVYVVDLETGEETPIATEEYNEDYPSFRKDGTEICYTGGPRGYREVMVHNLATGEKRTLTRGYGYVGSTNFSPDGSRIVFHTYFDNSYISGKADVFVVPSEGGKPVNITKDRDVWDYKPNWSWDGEWITFSSKRGTPNFNLWVMRPDGSDLRQITNVKGPVPLTSTGEVSMSNQNPMDQRWSNWTKDGRIGWHQINLQQGILRAVEVATGDETEMYTSEFAVIDLSLSPDGATLLFETDGEIYAMPAKPGAEAKHIASGVKPRWSRDGQSVSFLSRWGTRIGIVPATGGEARIIEARPDSWAAGSTDLVAPDGSAVAVVTENEDGQQSLVIANEQDGERMLVEDKVALTNPVWSAEGEYIFYGESIPPSVSYFITAEPVVSASN